MKAEMPPRKEKFSAVKRSMTLLCVIVGVMLAVCSANADGNRPNFQRILPQQTFDWTKFRFGWIDLSDPGAHIAPDDYSPDLRSVANAKFDARAAAGLV